MRVHSGYVVDRDVVAGCRSGVGMELRKGDSIVLFSPLFESSERCCDGQVAGEFPMPLFPVTVVAGVVVKAM